MNTSSPDSPCCLNRAYRGCPDGPVGERKDVCKSCLGESSEGSTCAACGGHGYILTVGLPSYQKELATKRRAEGWKRV